jgi:hypothetical protein
MINVDPDLNGNGLSRLELPFIIFWKNNNAEELYQLIKEVRLNHGLTPSWEIIIDICRNTIMEGNFKKFKPKSIMVDYPDEFIRKMRLTGLISLRGAVRRAIFSSSKALAICDFLSLSVSRRWRMIFASSAETAPSGARTPWNGLAHNVFAAFTKGARSRFCGTFHCLLWDFGVVRYLLPAPFTLSFAQVPVFFAIPSPTANKTISRLTAVKFKIRFAY